jgi:hypothetical protein
LEIRYIEQELARYIEQELAGTESKKGRYMSRS